MQKNNIFDIEGTEFPAGRRTRVMIGQNGAITGEKFCQGYVMIHPKGKIPDHCHDTVESYTILKGCGMVTVDGETSDLKPGDYVFIPAGKHHALVNTGDEELHLMFVYAPSVIVDHWAQEQAGELS